MPLKCVACQQSTGDEQPYYCERCFIPVPPYKDGKYIGHEQAICPECSTPLGENRKVCPNCDLEMSSDRPPKAKPLSEEYQVRERNRAALAKEVHEDARMTDQMIELLGIEHMPREQQGVALTSLSREKMNFLSVDYNFAEAHTLVDLGYAITKETGKDWAELIAATRMANYLYRAGHAMNAAEMLTDAYNRTQDDTQIQQYRKLEIYAHLALAHRLAGNKEIADTIAIEAHVQLLEEFQKMEVEVEEYINSDKTSQYMGSETEVQATFPRVDYISTILLILIEEIIARGAEEPKHVPDLVIDRMLELDNITKILGEMTPSDDVGYFASHLRDYVRLSNGLMWYGELLLPNKDTRRRYLIEQYYKRIIQWKDIIPVNYWLPLRPARFVEIFIRAENWSEDIDTENLISDIFKRSPAEYKGSWHYVIADAKSRAGQQKEAIKHLKIILDDREPYIDKTNDELKAYAQNLFNSIQLESIGILLGNVPSKSWINLPISIQLEDPTSPMEPETYLRDEFKDPVLRMSFDSPRELIDQEIALFGDMLLDVDANVDDCIISVGGRKFDDADWHTPSGEEGTVIEGHRMDVVVIRSHVTEDDTVVLLFEGKKQDYEKQDSTVILEPSELLTLRGIIHHENLDPDKLLNLLVNLMSADEQTLQTTDIFTLKKIKNVP